MSLKERLDHQSAKFMKALKQLRYLTLRISELSNLGSYLLTIDENKNKNNNNNNKACEASLESLIQQVDNLKGIKSIVSIYAQRKAQEITQLQCELYGEDAVRAAYDQEQQQPQTDELQQQQSQQQNMEQLIM